MRGFHKRLLSLLGTTAVLATLISAPAPASAAATRPDFGVQFHATWSDYTDAQRLQVLDMMAEAGVEWVRVDVGWASIQETGPNNFTQWHVNNTDKIVDAARARGLKVLVTFWTTPAWANNNAGSRVPPNNPADYARAATFMADHFRGRVDAWEVWNEPNLKDFWDGTAAQYAALLKAAYPAFKAGDPNAEVVLGGPSYNDVPWLEKVYANGAQGSFDIMSTHPYMGMADAPPTTPDDGTIWTMAHVKEVHNLMKANGDGDKEIWFTEFGWSSHATSPGTPNWERGVTENKQGQYLVDSLEYLKANHPYVTNVFWYNERNRDTGNLHLDNYGLLNRNLSPKPAYDKAKEYLTANSQPEPLPTVDPGPLPTDPGPELEPESTNLLSNGGFENGKKDWKGKKARLATTTDAYEGERSLKVFGTSGRIGAVSAAVPVDESSTYRMTGFLRTPKAGKMLKISLLQRKKGRTLAVRHMYLKTSDGWTQIPEFALSTIDADSVLRVKMKKISGKGGRFFADQISLNISP